MSYIVVILVIIMSTVYAFYRFLNETSGSVFADNSIDAFIIPDDNKGKKKTHTNADSKYKQDYTVEGRQLLIIYGTEYGCSEDVAKLLFDKIKEMNEEDELSPLQPRLINARDYNIINFKAEQVLLVVISTSGDGVPPTDAQPFCEFLQSSTDSLGHLTYSVLALGDTNYPQFCKTGRMVHDRLQMLGCECVVNRQEVDMEDWSVINLWINKVISYLQTAQLYTTLDYLHHSDITEDTFSRNKPFMATLKKKILLTVCEVPSDKETVHCEFDITGSDLNWTSGDALGIYPQNNPADVRMLLDAMKCSGTEQVNKPSWAYQVLEDSEDDVYSLSDVLQQFYDLKVVKYELIEVLASSVSDLQEKNNIEKLLKHGVSKSNTLLQNYLQEREVVDVLIDFKSNSLPWQQILTCMKSLQPRYYSISSSPMKDSCTVCVTAAILQYSINVRQGNGVTTTYLQDRLHIGNKCPVFMSRNPDFRLPSNHTLPIILIGPGTGIAPFMAFIQERAMEKSCGPVWLYFGCRHKNKDFLYKRELEQWESDNVIRLSVAFSRDQDKKQYVQDLIYRDRTDLWRLINQENASIFVCGDAKHMAHDVHMTLTQIVQEEGHMSESEASDYLCHMEKCSRYEKDVWVV